MVNCMCRCHLTQMPQQQHGRGELIWQKSCCIVYSEFCDARLGGIGHLRVREWHCSVCVWCNGWTEMEWGKEEQAQQEETQQELVVRLKGHAPWLQQCSPGLRRCVREAAATSPPGQDGHSHFAASRTAAAPAFQMRFAGAAGMGGLLV